MNIRPLQVARFTAIVLALAIAFIVIEEGFGQALSALIARGWVDGAAVTARDDSSASQAQCGAITAGIQNAGSAVVGRPESRAAVWMLGFRVGIVASIESRLDPPPPGKLKPFVDEMGQLAAAIGVALPAPFVAARTSFAFSEFERFVTTDQNCAAAMLQARLSAQHAALYRFAGFAGYSYAVHQGLPDGGPLFAPQLRQFGLACGLPPEIVERWVSPTAVGGVAAMSQLIAETGRAVTAAP